MCGCVVLGGSTTRPTAGDSFWGGCAAALRCHRAAVPFFFFVRTLLGVGCAIGRHIIARRTVLCCAGPTQQQQQQQHAHERGVHKTHNEPCGVAHTTQTERKEEGVFVASLLLEKKYHPVHPQKHRTHTHYRILTAATTPQRPARKGMYGGAPQKKAERATQTRDTGESRRACTPIYTHPVLATSSLLRMIILFSTYYCSLLLSLSLSLFPSFPQNTVKYRKRNTAQQRNECRQPCFCAVTHPSAPML